ncbi:solute carrier family 25 protein [archaeon]|nr:MAG: solute carrier family 25 protein [archaeon]
MEAGVAMVFLFNPVWVVKTRLALQGAETHITGKKYKGLSGAYMLYLCLTVHTLTHMVNAYECTYSYTCKHTYTYTYTCTYMYIHTYIHIHISKTHTHTHAHHPIDALRIIYREEGLAGLYTGLVPALLLTSHGAIQFAIYEHMKTLAFALYHGTEQPAWVSLLLGGGSKIIASTVTYPYQVIKSRLQQRQDSHSTRYRGTVDCIRRIWRSDGWMGFFRGCIPNALKVAPGSALTFVVYEECMKMFKSSDEGREIADVAAISEE